MVSCSTHQSRIFESWSKSRYFELQGDTFKPDICNKNLTDNSLVKPIPVSLFGINKFDQKNLMKYNITSPFNSVLVSTNSCRNNFALQLLNASICSPDSLWPLMKTAFCFFLLLFPLFHWTHLYTWQSHEPSLTDSLKFSLWGAQGYRLLSSRCGKGPKKPGTKSTSSVPGFNHPLCVQTEIYV